MAVAFEGENVGGQTVQEPAVVGDDHGAAGEAFQRLFERATSLRLSSKKMKFLFSRYLAYARAQADAALVERVRGLLSDVVDRLMEKTGGAVVI